MSGGVCAGCEPSRASPKIFGSLGLTGKRQQAIIDGMRTRETATRGADRADTLTRPVSFAAQGGRTMRSAAAVKDIARNMKLAYWARKLGHESQARRFEDCVWRRQFE